MEIFRLLFSPIQENTYILADQSGECAIIDCGCYDRDEFSRLTGLIEEKKLKPVLLLNTHCHLDHLFGNGMILETYNLATLCGREDEKNRENSVNYAIIFGLSIEKPPKPEGYLTDGQKITFGVTELTALHVPGHSPGSYAFYCRNDNVVFTGDALFKSSIGRSDFPGGDHETLINSIKNKLFVLPPETVVYPGHGDQTTIESEIKNNPYFQ